MSAPMSSVFPPAPAPFHLAPRPSRKGDPGCHLWVIDSAGIPYILEDDPAVVQHNLTKFKHTNLTGGRPAACGGELWFETPQRLYFNGCSGRYPVLSPQQLHDTERVFAALGYAVTSFGWDSGTNTPSVVLP